MKLIKATYEILTPIDGKEILKTVEKVARTCYKSEDKITDESAEKMIKSLIVRGHEAMIEFFDITNQMINSSENYTQVIKNERIKKEKNRKNM
jgi:thymidylate synthase (FAD)